MRYVITIIGFSLLLAACQPEVIITQPTDSTQSSSVSSAGPEPETAPGTTINPSVSSSSSQMISSVATSIPSSVRIDMPFASQAPTSNWDPPYDEACEEASLIIVRHYLEGSALDPSIMDGDIHEMVDYEAAHGLPVDIDMFQLADVARGMFGYEAEVLEGSDVSIERIEQEVAHGNPVIVPLAGQDIGNPYYSGDGPPYHVLVIVGYNSMSAPSAARIMSTRKK
jgi:hypothetical protein